MAGVYTTYHEPEGCETEACRWRWTVRHTADSASSVRGNSTGPPLQGSRHPHTQNPGRCPGLPLGRAVGAFDRRFGLRGSKFEVGSSKLEVGGWMFEVGSSMFDVRPAQRRALCLLCLFVASGAPVFV